MKKTKRLLLLILPLVLIGLVFVFLRLTIFADIAQGQFTLYRLSEFPNLFNHSASLGYQNIPLGKKEKVAEVSLRIPRGETEGLTLMLDNKTSAAADKLTILKGDFQDGKGNVLSKNLIDERVVHVWPTKQFDSTKPSAKRNFWSEDRDELLVKNDQTDFLSTSITPSVETQLNSNGGTGDNPDPQEPVLTSLSAGTSKKFYLKVTAPADQTGDFSSTVRFFDRGLNRELTKLTIKLTVLDLDLIKPSQGGYTMGCFNNDRIKTSDSAQIVGGEQLISQELFAIRMKKAKDYGCETMVQRIGPYSNNKRALEIFSELGYPGPIILNYYYFEQKSDGTKVINTEDVLSSAASKDEFKKIVTEIKDDKKITVPIIFYGYDEPNEPTQQPLHLEKVRNMDPIIRQVLSQKLGKSNISPSYSTTLLASTIKSFEEKGLKTDLPIVAYQSWPDYLSSIKSGAIYNPSASGFYYQGYMEFPLSNRLLSGFGLVNSGMKGSFANPLYGYSSAHERTRPLYDDFKVFAWKNGQPDFQIWNKQMMTFYPARNGYIPTYQAEGRREGIMDLRYYLTYKNLKESKPSCQNSAELTKLEKTIDTQIARFVPKTPSSTGLANSPYLDPERVSSADFDSLRENLKDYLGRYQNDCPPQGLDFPTGFKSFNSASSFNSNILPKSLILFKFGTNDWLRSRDKDFAVTSGDGLYIYNPNPQVSFQFSGQRSSSLNAKLKRGWNLLAAQFNSDLSNISTVIGSGSCKKVVPLQSLTELGSNARYASQYVPI